MSGMGGSFQGGSGVVFVVTDGILPALRVPGWPEAAGLFAGRLPEPLLPGRAVLRRVAEVEEAGLPEARAPGCVEDSEVITV